MLPGHGTQIHSIRVFSIHTLPITLVVSEAVLYTDNDPVSCQLDVLEHTREWNTHHKLVKTTPKPKATKKSSGELGPFPEFPELVAEGGGLAEVVEIKLVVVADILADMTIEELRLRKFKDGSLDHRYCGRHQYTNRTSVKGRHRTTTIDER